jgi:hypothetical protein
MVALEIDGPHITFRDLDIRGALLALTSLTALKLAVPDSLELVLRDVCLQGCAPTIAGGHWKGEGVKQRARRTVHYFLGGAEIMYCCQLR